MPVGRVLTVAVVDGLGRRSRSLIEAVGVPGVEEVGARRLDFGGQLPERFEVVEDPESTTVRTHDQVAEMLLYHDSVDG